MLEDFTLTIKKELINTQWGLIRDSVLSTTFYKLFLNDLLVEYSDRKIESRDSDDIICICSNMEQVKKALQIMKSWCENNEMERKKDKLWILIIIKGMGK